MGPFASWTDATTHTKGVRYWNGSATTQLFDDYTEYVALGVTNAGEKMFATAVVFLPGDAAGRGVGWAQLNSNTPVAVSDSPVDAAGDAAAIDGSLRPDSEIAPGNVESDCTCRIVAPDRDPSGGAIASLLLLASLVARRVRGGHRLRPGPR